MKKRILSFIAVFSFLTCMLIVPEINTFASEEYEMVDGSYLTNELSSSGTSYNNKMTRGTHLMTGECSITNAGIERIYAYAATTANKQACSAQQQFFHSSTTSQPKSDSNLLALKSKSSTDSKRQSRFAISLPDSKRAKSICSLAHTDCSTKMFNTTT